MICQKRDSFGNIYRHDKKAVDAIINTLGNSRDNRIYFDDFSDHMNEVLQKKASLYAMEKKV